jgi:putative ABC transport system permease protein
MVKNYLKIAWRNIWKAKGFSLLNIAGLGVGLAVCLLILFFVGDELSYDAYHEHADRIYRVQRAWLAADGSIRGEFANLAPSFVPRLRNDFPEIERIARIWGPGTIVVKSDDIVFTEERFFFAEPELFDIMTIPLVQGKASVLSETGSVILSRSTARKYFGNEDPLGKTLVVVSSSEFPMQVMGVMEDSPANSHIHFDFLASYLTLKGLYGSGDNDYFHGTRNFSDNVTGVFVRLARGVDGPDAEAKIPAFLDRIFPPRPDEQGRLVKTSDSQRLHFQKVKDIHLTSHTRSEYEPTSDLRTVVLFTIIAAFILVIACVNFMNLATARAVKRAKEVGLRKVVGAARRTLAVQFLGESLLVTFIALLLALGFVALALPAFSRFTGHSLSFGGIFAPTNFAILLGGFLLTGLVSGLYPALYISSYRPGTILRGELTRGKGGAAFRKALVVFQFAISIGLIFSVTVVTKQMRYIQNADLGYDRENILLVPVGREILGRWPDIKTGLLEEKDILAATLSKRAPTGRLLDSPGFWAEVRGEKIQSAFSMPHNRVEHDFFKTFGMDIVAGRDFSIDHPSDATDAFILNETAVRRLGFERPEDAIDIPFGTIAPFRTGRVIGVVRDFNYESLRETVVPIVTYVLPAQANTLSLRIAPGSMNRVLEHVQAVLDRASPGGPRRADFLADRLFALYRNERRTMKMFGAFSLLAVSIGCLGLFGLAAFSAERRTKEIGVRKVLGATSTGIAAILAKEFTRWVVVANLIAWPLAYLGMTDWLRSFAYRTSIGAWPFLLSGALALAIALLTVSAQAIKAALADPVRSLRYE